MTLTYTGPYDQIATVADPNGNVTAFAYDDSGNAVSATYADQSKESWGYDAQGNVTAWTNRRGKTMTFTYDTAGQLTSKSYTDSSHVDYAYDARGNLHTATDSRGTAFTYDTSDYLTRHRLPGREVSQLHL